MRRNIYHHRHPTLSDGIDIMAPPSAYQRHETSGAALTHNHNHPHRAQTQPQRSLFGNYHNRHQNDNLQMEETTLEFLASMANDSFFFEENPPRPIPSLERSEMNVDGVVGMGEFGVVMKVVSISPAIDEEALPPPLKDESHNNNNNNGRAPNQNSNSPSRPSMKQVQSCTALTSLDWLDESTRSTGSILIAEESVKDHVALQSRRDLAVKQLRKDLYPKKRIQAAMDLAREAKFLASLRHPNIIALKGMVSQPGRLDFGILFERLRRTLDEQKTEWKEQCLFSSQYIFPWQSQQRILDFRRILTERVAALRDVARAMRHLHTKLILFRDLKAENCAQSNNDNKRYKLFDFGLAKELKIADRIHHDDKDGLYKATGLTGTLRIMAPEVIQCQAYGLSADVYSFGVMMYEIFAGERCQLTAAEICKLDRPKVPAHMGRPFSDWLQACWSHNPRERPTMETICKQMEVEYDRLAGSTSATTSPEHQQQ